MSEHPSPRAFDAQAPPRFVTKLVSGQAILFRPRGRSMSPALPDGTVVMVDPATRPPELFDVVLAVLDGHVVMHRVVWMHGDHVWLMGDAHRHSEGPLHLNRIVGFARLQPPQGMALWLCHARRLFFLLTHLGRLSC